MEWDCEKHFCLAAPQQPAYPFDLGFVRKRNDLTTTVHILIGLRLYLSFSSIKLTPVLVCAFCLPLFNESIFITHYLCSKPPLHLQGKITTFCSLED